MGWNEMKWNEEKKENHINTVNNMQEKKHIQFVIQYREWRLYSRAGVTKVVPGGTW